MHSVEQYGIYKVMNTPEKTLSNVCIILNQTFICKLSKLNIANGDLQVSQHLLDGLP